MTAIERIHDFLSQNRFAVVGVSRQPKDFSRMLFRELVQRGYDAIPVNPKARDIDGRPCFSRIEEIQPPIEGALLMTAPAITETLVRDCAAARIKRVWMFRGGGTGAVSAEAVRFCESSGISVIPGECPFMYLPRTGWVHRLHGLIRKIARTYPV
jgi:predicted CoA-binding protein